MRKIVFNGLTFRNDEFYGIARHTYELLLELDKIVEPNTVEILAPKCNFPEDTFKNIKFVKKGKYSDSNKIIAFIWKYVIFRAYCFFSHALTVNTYLACKFYNFDVMSIYDCTAEVFYQNVELPPDRDKWYKNLIRNQHKSVKHCKLILTDSESARNDINHFYDVDLDKISVIYCGWQHISRVQEDETVIDRFDLKDKEYFFTLGSRLPHKNINWISYAAKNHPNYKFVVTGSQHGYVDMSFEGEKLDNMIFTGYLKDEEIKALMKHCRAFILPSFYEGFGIPPMEAMSVGAECIVSNVASLPEVYKNSVWYIDPNDYNNINLDDIMSQPKDSIDLVLNEFSWEKSAKKLLPELLKLAT